MLASGSPSGWPEDDARAVVDRDSVNDDGVLAGSSPWPPDDCAALIVYCSNGIPFKRAMFFLGIPFDPPRAGIKAKMPINIRTSTV